MNAIVLAIAGIAVVGGGILIYEQTDTPRCTGAPVGAPANGAYPVRVTIQDNQTQETFRVCIQDANGNKLLDRTLDVPQGETARYWDFGFEAAPATFTVVGSAGGGVEIHDLAPWSDCHGARAELFYQRLEKQWDGSHGSMIAADCTLKDMPKVERQPGAPSTQRSDMGFMAVPDHPGPPLTGAAFMVAGGGGLLFYVVLRFRGPLQWAFVGLFTRLATPKLLEQAVRNQIHELVQQEPGVRAPDVARRLELAKGQTLHHLRVCVRGKLFSAVRNRFSTHYFIRGSYDPYRMQQLALLREPSVARVHQIVRDTPGLRVTDLAARAGLSLSRTSRVGKRLVGAGLARAERRGRELNLFPSQAAG